MNNLYESYNNLPFDNVPNLIHGRINYDDNEEIENDAHKLLRKDCEEYYRVSMNQITVKPLYPRDASIESILSKAGLEKYNFVKGRAQKEENFKDELPEYACEYVVSGGWFSNKKSPFYDSKDLKGILNCRANIHILGWSKKHKSGISTSPVVFIHEPEPGVDDESKVRWCITKSGSLYKLGNKLDIWEMDALLKERKGETK